jgi:hypothetical protein
MRKISEFVLELQSIEDGAIRRKLNMKKWKKKKQEVG